MAIKDIINWFEADGNINGTQGIRLITSGIAVFIAGALFGGYISSNLRLPTNSGSDKVSPSNLEYKVIKNAVKGEDTMLRDKKTGIVYEVVYPANSDLIQNIPVNLNQYGATHVPMGRNDYSNKGEN